MKKAIITIILGISGIAAAAQPQHFGYTNPVIPGFHPDPSVCRVGDDYYLVNSSFQYFPGVPVFHSKDLIHWEQIGNCLTRESQLLLKDARSDGGIYAPTIRYNDGTFYMITTNVSGKGNFFVTATDPSGEWSDPIWLEQGGIDPSLYFEDSKAYMVSNPNNGIYLCEIDINTGKQLTDSKILWQGDGGRYPEAPHIYKKDGWYYLMIAEGGTEYGHSITIARSRDIYGPYESNPDNPILSNFRRIAQNKEIQGTGHGDLVEDQEGLWWIVFLGFRPQNGDHHLLGRETFLEPVDWPEDAWPTVNGDGTADIIMNVATLPQAKVPDVDDNRLASGRIEPWFIHVNTPVKENYGITQDGYMRLKPTALTLDDAGSPTFIAIRQDSHDFILDSKVDLSSATLDDVAGLSVYMDNFAHADIFLRQQKSKKKLSVVVEYTLYGLKYKAYEAEIAKEATDLRIEGDKTMYKFSYRKNGKWIEAGTLDTRLLSTETAGGFTGITLGMFACSAKGGGFSCADFHNFTYRRK